MDIGPIWRAMLRNKAGFILIALQMAVTLTILVNAFGIIQENSEKIAEESGMDEANTFTLASVLYSDYEREQRMALIDGGVEARDRALAELVAADRDGDCTGPLIELLPDAKNKAVLAQLAARRVQVPGHAVPLVVGLPAALVVLSLLDEELDQLPECVSTPLALAKVVGAEHELVFA